MSPQEVKIYAAEHYCLIGLFFFLLVLVNVNMWNIIIRQKKYNTLPLLAFYIFAFLAISFKLVILIWYFEEKKVVFIFSLS